MDHYDMHIQKIQELLNCYQTLYQENLQLRRDNARLVENERDMLRASTVVTTLNENHALKQQVKELQEKLSKALLAGRASSSKKGSPMPEPEPEPEPESEPEPEPESETESDDQDNWEIVVFKKKQYALNSATNCVHEVVEGEGRWVGPHHIGNLVINSKSGRRRIEFI